MDLFFCTAAVWFFLWKFCWRMTVSVVWQSINDHALLVPSNWIHRWRGSRILYRCNRRCISGDRLLWAIVNQRLQSFLLQLRRRESFYAGSQTFPLIRRQCSTFWNVDPRFVLQLICLGTLDHVMFFLWCLHFLVFPSGGLYPESPATLQVWDLEASIFPRPPKVYRQTYLSIFCVARNHLWYYKQTNPN